MINLIGCNKDNFFELLKLMNYKYKENKKDNEDLFIYKPNKHKKDHEKKTARKPNEKSPFDKLSEIRFR